MIEKTSSVEADVLFPIGVGGTLLFFESVFLHLLMPPEPTLSLDMLVAIGVGAGTCDKLVLVVCGEGVLKLIETPSTLSAVFTEPSRAFEEVVASPESLLDTSSSSNPLRYAGWVSVGGCRGGATVTGMGGFAATVSSYRKAINPSSGRKWGVVATDLVRMLPEGESAIVHLEGLLLPQTCDRAFLSGAKAAGSMQVHCILNKRLTRF